MTFAEYWNQQLIDNEITDCGESTTYNIVN